MQTILWLARAMTAGAAASDLSLPVDVQVPELGHSAGVPLRTFAVATSPRATCSEPSGLSLAVVTISDDGRAQLAGVPVTTDALSQRLSTWAAASRQLAARCAPWGGGGFPGRVLFVVDERAPTALVIPALRAAVDGGFPHASFLVAPYEQVHGADVPPAATPRPGETVEYHIDPDGYWVRTYRARRGDDHTYSCRALPCTVRDGARRFETTLTYTSALHEGGEQGIVAAPAPAVDWGTVLYVVGGLYRAPAGDPWYANVWLAAGAARRPDVRPPARPARAVDPAGYAVDEVVPVVHADWTPGPVDVPP